jgi:hypothetical protein
VKSWVVIVLAPVKVSRRVRKFSIAASVISVGFANLKISKKLIAFGRCLSFKSNQLVSSHSFTNLNGNEPVTIKPNQFQFVKISDTSQINLKPIQALLCRQDADPTFDAPISSLSIVNKK